MEVPEGQLSSLMGTLTDIHMEAENMGEKRYLDTYCGLACWVQWMSGRIFCQHNQQICTDCGMTWMRFNEPEDHLQQRKDGRMCRDKIPEETRATIRSFR